MVHWSGDSGIRKRDFCSSVVIVDGVGRVHFALQPCLLSSVHVGVCQRSLTARAFRTSLKKKSRVNFSQSAPPTPSSSVLRFRASARNSNQYTRSLCNNVTIDYPMVNHLPINRAFYRVANHQPINSLQCRQPTSNKRQSTTNQRHGRTINDMMSNDKRTPTNQPPNNDTNL